MTGKEIRLRRLFSQQNAVIVAADHGEFDGPITGMVDLPRTLAQAVNPAVNAVLLSPGMVAHCRELFTSRDGPLAVVRLNWNSVYAFHWGYGDAAGAVAVSAQEALALGADIVLVSLTLRTGSEERDARNVDAFCRLVQEAHRLGVPAIGEFFPARSHKLTQEEMHDLVRTGARIVAELGADLVKTFYTCRFPEVVEGCPIPILGLGAEKTDTQLQALELAESEIRDGARGVVFGRNALQVPDPQRFQAALCAVVREGISAVEAAGRFDLEDDPGEQRRG
jgi:fructose-bisphosphate aldolase/2-amino-3,7-dideoxy-D-threo-hept-6-ulosonate synthase